MLPRSAGVFWHLRQWSLRVELENIVEPCVGLEPGFVILKTREWVIKNSPGVLFSGKHTFCCRCIFLFFFSMWTKLGGGPERATTDLETYGRYCMFRCQLGCRLANGAPAKPDSPIYLVYINKNFWIQRLSCVS